PATGRHSVVVGFTRSAPHALFVPSQKSSASQTSVAERQTLLVVATLSAPQSLLTPSQKSSASQMSVAARQSVVGGSTASAGQADELPGQKSGASQKPSSGRQTLAVVLNLQVAAQQTVGPPLLPAPRSQSSRPGSIAPSLQSETMLTFTK